MAEPAIRGVTLAPSQTDDLTVATPATTAAGDTIFTLLTTNYALTTDMVAPVDAGVTWDAAAVSNVKFGNVNIVIWRGIVKAGQPTGARSIVLPVPGASDSAGLAVTCQGEHTVCSGVTSGGQAQGNAGGGLISLPSVTSTDATGYLCSFWGVIQFNPEAWGPGPMIDPVQAWFAEHMPVHAGNNFQEARFAYSKAVTTSATGVRTAQLKTAAAANEPYTYGFGGVMFAIRRTSATAAPSVDSGADAAHVVNTAFNRTATENNNGSTITSRAWTIVAGPTGVGSTIGTAAALSWTPTVIGSYTLRYTATNAVGSGTDDVIVGVAPAGVDPGTPVAPPAPPDPEGTASEWSNSEVQSTSFSGAWIHPPANPGATLRLPYGGVGRQESRDRAKTSLQFVGRQYPVYDVGEARAESIQITSQIIREDGDVAAKVARAREIGQDAEVVLFRDGRGRKLFAIPTDWTMTDLDQGGYEVSFLLNRVDYDEALPGIED